MSNNIFRNLIGLGIVLGLLLPAQVVCPQNAVKPGDATVAKPKAAPPPTPKKAEKSDEDQRVKIEHADKMSYDPNTKVYHITGNVVFANKTMRLFCDVADYNEESDSAKASGHLRAVDENSVVTGDLMEADFGKEISIVTGNVTIVTQKKPNKVGGEKPETALSKPKEGKPSESTQANAVKTEKSATAAKDKSDKDPEHVEDYWEKKTTITCERLEYYYADDVKKMIATPRVKAVQEDKTVWADQAVFEDIPRLVTLTGNVVLNTEKGDEMHCTKAVVSVDEDWVQAENMSGVTLRKSKKEPATKPAAKPAEKPAQTPAEAPKPAAEAQPAPAPKPVEPPAATLQSQG